MLRRLLREIFPRHCLFCISPTRSERPICAPCLADLPWNDIACKRCALPLATPAERCADCMKDDPAYDACLCIFRYEQPIDRLLMRFKFYADLAAGAALAELLANKLRESPEPPDLILPVPMHTSRLRRRGFNQAWEICKALAKSAECPTRHDLLRRKRSTMPQTGLTAGQRKKNLRDAFQVAGALQGAHVGLVDDVVTTGETVHRCAEALKGAGALKVTVLALARAQK